jgi:diaminopimelate decarboxylase
MELKMDEFDDLIRSYGSPLVIYDEEILKGTYIELLHSLNGGKLIYSVKANPNVEVIRSLDKVGALFEVASENEYELLKRAGIEPVNIIFGGQAKTRNGIERAVKDKVLFFNLESEREVELLVDITEKENVQCKFLLRINPDMEQNAAIMKMSSCASPFGVDVARLDEAVMISNGTNAIFSGFFMYNGSQYYQAEDIIRNTKYLLGVAKKYAKKYKIEYLDFGGGFGVIESDTQDELELKQLENGLKQITYSEGLPNLKSVFYESGRFITTKCGTLVATVIDTKWSKGKRLVILDTGITNLGVRQMCYRLFEPFTDFVTNNNEIITQTLVGPTCTSIDNIRTDCEGKKLSIGDYVLFKYAGSYLLSYSPIYFCGQSTPCEVMKTKNGEWILTKRKTNIANDFGYNY